MKEPKEKNNLPLAKDEQVVRSNELITAKYTSSLIENKLLVLALKMASVGSDGRATATISMNELRMLSTQTGHSFYDTLKKACSSMIGRSIYMEDKKENHFLYISIIHKAEFKDGILTVTFTPEVNDYLYNLKSGFTPMSIQMLWSFSSNYSYRLYEILKTHFYRIPSSNEPVSIVYGISELKLQLNCINTEEKRVKEELRKPKPDVDKIVNELVKDKKYTKWYEFKRKVLDKAVKEINEVSDMFIDYEPIKVGRGGKVIKVRFMITRNEDHKNEIDIIEIENDDKVSDEMKRSLLIDEVFAIIDEANISQQDTIALLKAADNDIEKIRTAYRLLKTQSHPIKNFMGWMTEAIRKGYEDPIEVVEGSTEKATVVEEIHENMMKNEESLAEKAWNKFKKKEDFDIFTHYLYNREGLEIDIFEDVTDVKERVKIYTEWIRGGKPVD